MGKSGIRCLALFCAGTLLLSGRSVAVGSGRAKGDVDGDGKITPNDARFILRASVGLEDCAAGSETMQRGDVDADGVLTAADARYVLRASVGLTDINTLKDISEAHTAAAAPGETESATQAPAEPAASPWPLSATGYEIREYEGVTYVGGVLIANKTYGLPPGYAPGQLTAETYNAFLAMQADALKEGLDLYISSGYRSYSTQRSLYERYVRQDGMALADRYSARPGHSEHQTGLAFDLNTITESFGNSPEGRWVAKNCYKYGFILRYPKEKEAVTGYMYEPWHLRYLGTDLAARVYQSGLCLEEYLGITSAYR